MTFLKITLTLVAMFAVAASPAFAADIPYNVYNGADKAATKVLHDNGDGTYSDQVHIGSGSAIALPTGAATAAKQPALGTAGTPSADVITVQGASGGTALPIGGAVADAAADSGNSVKLGCVVKATPTSVTDATRQPCTTDSLGGLFVVLKGNGSATAMQGVATNADAVAATSVVNSLRVGSFGFVYNGTTWDRLRKANTVCRIVSSAATTNATSCKASAGDLYMLDACNTTVTLKFLKIYNKASSPTVGTDTPLMTVAIPASNCVSRSFAGGLYFGTGLALALTGAAADNDTTALSSGDVVAVNLAYQ